MVHKDLVSFSKCQVLLQFVKYEGHYHKSSMTELERKVANRLKSEKNWFVRLLLQTDYFEE